MNVQRIGLMVSGVTLGAVAVACGSYGAAMLQRSSESGLDSQRWLYAAVGGGAVCLAVAVGLGALALLRDALKARESHVGNA